jgi:TIR domain/Effector-associated domain 1
MNQADPNRKLQVFLCHANDDKPEVRKLYTRLSAEAWIQPWLDEEDIDGGADWNYIVRRAIASSDAMIVLMSNHSVSNAGFRNKEIKLALEKLDELPEGDVFIIPLKLEECQTPYSLEKYHALKYFEPNSYERLLRSLRNRAQKLGINTERVQAPPTASSAPPPTSKVTMEEKISNTRSDFEGAILAAYQGDEAGLKRVLNFKLSPSVNLDDITSANGLRNKVSDLVQWVKNKGRLAELLEAAHQDNPGNPELKAYHQKCHQS